VGSGGGGSGFYRGIGTIEGFKPIGG